MSCAVCQVVYVFFFSSRRRHTRCSRDWSSDVCSSDLLRYNFVYRADRGWVYAIRSLDTGAGQMQDVIMEREGSGPEYPTIEVAASSATYRPKGPAGGRGWTLRRGAVRYLVGGTREAAVTFGSLRIR